MRQNSLERLRELDDKLSVLNNDVVGWVERFVSAYQFDAHSGLLMNYNLEVLSWISNWSSTFCHALTTESVYKSENADSDLEAVIERERTKLKTFLALRHHFLPWGMRDITASPYMPAHMACVFAVEAVIKETESACLWLMPWVERVIGSALETDIKSSTENEHGKFQTPHYVMSSDRKSLIAVKDYCEYIESSPVVADAFFSNDGLQADIKRAFGKPVINYLKAVQYFHVRRTTDATVFGFHAFNLATALHESSVNRLGREYQAKEGYEEALRRFHDLWEKLPATVREQLASTRTDGYPHSFEDYLLTLFVTVPEIPLSNKIKLRVEKLGIIKCAAVLSSTLFEFINKNKDWYTLSVFGSNDDLPIYTQDDLIQLRETFNNMILGKTSCRIFAWNDAFAVSIRSHQQKCYDNFFKMLELIPSFSVSEWLKIAEDPKKLCVNANEVLSFLSAMPNNQVRSKCWHVFSPIWQSYFFQLPEIIILFYMMDHSDTELLNVSFNGKIQCFLESDSTFNNLLNLQRLCEKFNFSLADVRQSFVKSILAFSPLLIASPSALLKCLSVFTTETEFLYVLTSTQETSEWLFSDKGEALLDFLNQLRTLKSLNHLDFEAEIVQRAVLQYVLPDMVSHDRMQEIWTLSTPQGCCGFFGRNKIDITLHTKLAVVNDKLMKGMCTASEAGYANMKLLHEYMANNEGGDFLRAVKSSFCTNFFEQINPLLQENRLCLQTGVH